MNGLQSTLSFEFFPPKTESQNNILLENLETLKGFNPSFVSVTYGAGGGRRDDSLSLVKTMASDFKVVAHLTCIGHSKDEVLSILKSFDQLKVSGIMALRGDPPKYHLDMGPGDFPYAKDLVCFIKKNFPNLKIGVAGFPEGHPHCPNRLKEIDYLKAKVDAGADFICTQLFFDNRDFYDFCERLEIAGIKVPVIAGVMPISSRKNLQTIAELALGARIPASLLRAVERAPNDQAVENIGIHWACAQVLNLIDSKVAGVHFYTLNKKFAVEKIFQTLGLQSSVAQSSLWANK